MLVKSISLKNFRNYEDEFLVLSPGRNVIIGENAQGKTNLLEAVEFASRGKSTRTAWDSELIRKDARDASLELDIVTNNYEEKLNIGWRVKQEIGATRNASSTSRPQLEKSIKINGVKQGSPRSLIGHLVTVSFTSGDLNLLRGGPKFRRDWIDDLISTLQRSYSDTLSKFQKIVSQRNKLLKSLFEKGRRMTTEDREQLKVWDQQVSSYGAKVIKQRIEGLSRVMPLAEHYQQLMSGQKEVLGIRYLVKTATPPVDPDGYGASDESDGAPAISSDELAAMEETELARRLFSIYGKTRGEEIARKQTLSGPHRDDLLFDLNGMEATAYASQGQQRTLVLALKLAELSLVKDHLDEPPVLLLDDVMAELDLGRQGFLMSCVDEDMQTIITTTHIDGFKDEWLEGAEVTTVANGQIEKQSTSVISQQ